MTTLLSRTLRVLCVDDSSLVADSLRRLVESEPSLLWAGSATGAAGLSNLVRSLRPDVILMDVDIPGVDTFDLVTRLCAEWPETRVVMFSGHVHVPFIQQALRCGAWGYLSKNEDTLSLIEGILQAGRGQIALSSEVRAALRVAPAEPAALP